MNFSTIQASCRTGESARPIGDRLRPGRLEAQIAGPVLGRGAKPLDRGALLVGGILAGFGQHAQVRERVGIRRDVGADHRGRRVDPEVAGDAPADVIAMGAVALVAQPAHQLDHRAGGARALPAWLGDGRREPESGQRRDHDVERVPRIGAVGARIRQRADQAEIVDERSRVAVEQEQRRGIRLARAHVDEVDRLAVDGRRELRQLVDPGLLGAPVERGAPPLGESLEVVERHALAPALARQGVGPARARESIVEIVEVGLRDVDAERADARIERAGRHRSHLRACT